MNSEIIEANRGEIPNLMHQHDLTTGYHSIHRYDMFSHALVENYRTLLPNGGLIPLSEGQFTVRINGPRFTLFCRRQPIHEGGIGIGRDSTWCELHGIIRNLGWVIRAKPRDRLWVAEVLLPSIYELELEDDPINWVFDFVRHLAVAMATSDSNAPLP